MKNMTGGDFCGGLPREEAQLLAQAMQTTQRQSKQQGGFGHLSDARAIGASPDPSLVTTLIAYNNPCCSNMRE